jgi:phosphoribosylformylglycinamidine synthase
MKPKALVLLSYGTNRDQDIAEALFLAGADPVIVPLNELRAGRSRFAEFQLLVLPGGFSYADALGAGKLVAIDLNSYFGDEIHAFVASGKPVIGVCNGFQALVKSGILPGHTPSPFQGEGRGEGPNGATLTFNQHGHFECRWVTLKPVSQKCVWTRGLTDLVTCPVAHGEGNFQTINHDLLTALTTNDQIAISYVTPDGAPAHGGYPANPNGSQLDIAGLTNPQGNVLGMMPHPENHIHPHQHPNWTRGISGRSGLALFSNGVRFANAS